MSTTTRRLIFTFWALMAAVPLPTLAGQPGDHEKAFFIRNTVGFGYTKTENEEGSPSAISGGSFALDVAVGATVAKNLAIHATFFAWTIFPKVDVVVLGTKFSTDASMFAFGAGLTTYFMPVNLYVSANAGAGRLGGDFDSEWGLAMNFIVGKEWWAGKRWGMERGMGIAAAVGYHSVRDPDVDNVVTPEIHDKWDGFNVALLFTGTLN